MREAVMGNIQSLFKSQVMKFFLFVRLFSKTTGGEGGHRHPVSLDSL